jgi:hypothetical protein
VALLEEGIMLAFIPNTSSQPQAQWLPVQKVDVPITLLSPGTWNPNDLKTLDTMRNTAKELDLIVANSATKAKSAYFQVFAPANDPEGTNLLLLLQNKYNDPANGLTLVDPQLQTINAGYKVIVRHLP